MRKQRTKFTWTLHQEYNHFRGHVRLSNVTNSLNSFVCMMFGSVVAILICPTNLILHPYTPPLKSKQYETSVNIFLLYVHKEFNNIMFVHGGIPFPQTVSSNTTLALGVPCRNATAVRSTWLTAEISPSVLN